MRPNYLFQNGSISQVLDAHAGQCRQKVDAISKDRFLATPVDDLVEFIVADMTVEPLVIYEDRMTREQSEINIDVAGWPGRYTRGDGPCLVAGIRVVKSLPPAPVGGFKPEWTIDEKEYENILTIIRHEGREV